MSSNFILSIIFFGLTGLVVVIRKTYFEIPLTELKKRRDLGEGSNDSLINLLKNATALRTLLWIKIAGTFSLGAVLLARSISFWLTFVVISLLTYYFFSFLPHTKISRFDRRLSQLFIPALDWFLSRYASQVNRLSRPLSRHYRQADLPIYDQQDLLQLLKDLSRRTDQRIGPELLLSLQRTFSLNDRFVKDFMIPAKKVKKLLASDVIGPVLINDLHESNEGLAVVREEPKGEIVGTLSIADLSIRSQGVVASHMQKDLYYLNESAVVLEVIKAYYETKSTFFIVQDASGKFVGLVTLSSALKQLTGPIEQLNNQEYSKR